MQVHGVPLIPVELRSRYSDPNATLDDGRSRRCSPSESGELRANVTAYDANCVALGEALAAELLSADAKLARAVDRVARCKVTVT